jgi:succinate dehydrogenase flavin-adding protein (antitoxin of CptAB toxin-antitoxin module)
MVKLHCIPNKIKYTNAYILYVELLMKLEKSKDSFFFILIYTLTFLAFLLALIFRSIVLGEFGCAFLLIIVGFKIHYILKSKRIISNFKKNVNTIPEENFNKEFDLIFEIDQIRIDSHTFKYDELRNYVRYKDLLFIEKKDNTLFNVILSKEEIDNETFSKILEILHKKNINEFKHKFIN